MTDQTPEITVAVHFLGQPEPSIFHADGVYADADGFVVIYSTSSKTSININKDIIERYVSMPYDSELGVEPSPTEAEQQKLIDDSIALAAESARVTKAFNDGMNEDAINRQREREDEDMAAEEQATIVPEADAIVEEATLPPRPPPPPDRLLREDDTFDHLDDCLDD